MSQILDGTVQVLGMLFIIVILMVYLSHVFSKQIAKGLFKAAKSKHLSVVDQIMIGQERCLLIAKMEERCFLIGVTPGGMSLITELTPQEASTFHEDNLNVQNNGFKEMFLDRFGPKSKR